MDHRQQLIELIRKQGLPSPDGVTPLPVVSLEFFFEGNDDYGSIGCNLADHPGPQRFLEVLAAIRARPDVQDVLVEIHEVEELDPTMWPFSERVYILSSAEQGSVVEWLTELHPDAVEEGYAAGRPTAAPDTTPPYRVWAAWWD
jgi:hypothetical protein